MDHFIKRELKIKKYVRYVDDFVAWFDNKKDAQLYCIAIDNFLNNPLNLQLSKCAVFSNSRCLNFVGYRMWRSTRLVRKHSLYKFSKALKAEDIPTLNSLLSHALNTGSFNFFCKALASKNSKLKVPVMGKYYESLSI